MLLGLKKEGTWAQRQFEYGQWCKNTDISRWLRSFPSPWTRTCRFSFRQTPIFPRLFPMWRSQKWHVAITKNMWRFPRVSIHPWADQLRPRKEWWPLKSASPSWKKWSEPCRWTESRPTLMILMELFPLNLWLAIVCHTRGYAFR